MLPCMRMLAAQIQPGEGAPQPAQPTATAQVMRRLLPPPTLMFACTFRVKSKSLLLLQLRAWRLGFAAPSNVCSNHSTMQGAAGLWLWVVAGAGSWWHGCSRAQGSDLMRD